MMSNMATMESLSAFPAWECGVEVYFAREKIFVEDGQTLACGAVLGRTQAGKYVALDPSATDGSEIAAGVLVDAVAASGGDAPGVAWVRLTKFRSVDLVWPDGITDAQRETALTQLAARHIIAAEEV